ncbi:UNVERIFIED_ORG: hypothetical protein BDU10_1230 [Burkholderia sp. CF145]
MPQFTEGDDLTVLIRFVRALALVLLTLATLAITLAMFWRDVGLDSFFDVPRSAAMDKKIITVARAVNCHSDQWPSHRQIR